MIKKLFSGAISPGFIWVNWVNLDSTSKTIYWLVETGISISTTEGEFDPSILIAVPLAFSLWFISEFLPIPINI